MFPQDSIAIHRGDIGFIAEALQTPFAGQSVLVTHHAPHPGALRNYSEDLDAAYASDLS